MAFETFGPKRRLIAELPSHLPILGLVVVAAVVFAGLHGAVTVAAWGFGLHVVAAIGLLGFRRLHRKSSRTGAANQ